MSIKNKKSLKKISQAAGILALGSIPVLQAQAYDPFGPDEKKVEIKQQHTNGYRQVVYSFNDTTPPVKRAKSEEVKPKEKIGTYQAADDLEKSKLVQELEKLKLENKELKRQLQILQAEIENAKNPLPDTDHSDEKDKAILVNEQQKKVSQTRSSQLASVNTSDPDVRKKNTVTGQEFHHVVYIFKTQDEQQKFWNTLSAEGENDRWQGVSKKNGRYFIYVGAYKSSDEAAQRAEYMNKMTGKKPVVYANKSSS